MKLIKKIGLLALTAMLGATSQAQTNPVVIPPGMIAVFKAGTSDGKWPMISARVNPCFVQVYDPSQTNQNSSNSLISVALATNTATPGSVWINAHAGSEGGGLSRSVNREYLCLEGYTGNILSSTSAKPSTDPTVTRGIVTLDAFTNPVSVFSSTTTWFGIPLGAPASTQDNPTGIASMDGTNFWGTGNFAGTSGELDGTLFYNSGSGSLQEVQNYLQAAGEARIIGGTLLVAVKAATGVASGLYNFVDPASGSAVPLPWDPDVSNPYFNFTFTNLYVNWGSQFQTILNFDMDPGQTVVYGADQTYGIVKFNNIGGTWVQAPYFFGTTNLGTLAQTTGNQGAFGICVDFSGPNPVIYATTMENGCSTNIPGGFGVNTSAGHQNNNRIIKIVDTGVNPGTNMVAQTLAVAQTTNEFFGGVDFTPDLRPLITTNPASYSAVSGSTVPFSVTVDSVYNLAYQWLQNGTNLVNQTNSTLTLSGFDTSFNSYTYQCVVTNYYGAVTSSVAVLTVTATPVAPTNTTSLNIASGFISGSVAFPSVSATGTQPFTYQWYFNGNALSDGPNITGSGYTGSQAASLAVTNLQLTDSGSYYVVISNGAGYASNKMDILTVNYHPAVVNAGQPAAATTLLNVPVTLTATETAGTPTVTSQWYQATLNTNGAIISSKMLTDTGDFGGTATTSLTITPSTLLDGTNYFIVFSNGAGNVTSSVAQVTVITPPAASQVSYTSQIYTQNFDSLPDPGTGGVAKNGTASGNGLSVNSINNPKDPGPINGVIYSLANPFDFGFPVIANSYVGGLGLGSTLNGWYGAADTNLADAVDGITRFGAQDGDQSTGGVIDFGLNDVEGGIAGTNRALGLISTGTTGSTAFGLKLVNTSTTTLSNLNVSFIGELWRNNTGARVVNFSYTLDNTANSFVLQTQPEYTNNTPQDLPNALTVPSMAFSFPTNPTGTLIVDGTQPANRVNVATNFMQLSTPWQPGAALWLVWSINYYGAGGGQGLAIDNLTVYGTSYPPAAPVATTSSATKITSTTAQLNASVNPSNAPTTYWFQYGTTTSYGSSPTTNLLNSVYGSSSVNAALTGLKQLTTYHYRIIASNSVNVVTGLDNTFTTLTNPVVNLSAVTGLSASAATLNGSVNPNNGITTNWFQFGTTTNYGTMAGSNVLASSLGFVPVGASLTGLLPGTVYHYQLLASSAAGKVSTVDTTFTNLSISVPNVGPVNLGANGFALAFTNATGASFSILATNVLTAPRTNWPVVGHAVESPAGSGTYYFTNAAPTGAVMYYIIRQP